MMMAEVLYLVLSDDGRSLVLNVKMMMAEVLYCGVEMMMAEVLYWVLK